MSTTPITSPAIMAQAADLVGDELQQLQDLATAMVLFLETPEDGQAMANALTEESVLMAATIGQVRWAATVLRGIASADDGADREGLRLRMERVLANAVAHLNAARGVEDDNDASAA